MEQNIQQATLQNDSELVRAINGAIKLQIKAHGNITPTEIGSLSKRIVGAIDGMVNNSMVKQLNESIDRQKFIVIAKEDYDLIRTRDVELRNQIKNLVERLKLVDPNFKQRN